MPNYCCVPGCKYAALASSIGVPIHQFPRDDRLRRDWLIAIRSDELPVHLKFEQLKVHKRVCGKHFAPSDYERDFQHELLGSKRRWVLKKTAIPATEWNRQERESKSLKDSRREMTKSKVEKCRMRERLVREMMTLRAQLKSRAETVPTTTDLVSEGDVRVEPMSELISGEEICEEPKPDLISTEHIKTEAVDWYCEDETQCIDLLATKNNSTTVCSLGRDMYAFKVTKLELEPAQSCDSSAVEAETVDKPSGVSSINGQSNDIETLEMECIDVEDPTLADVESEPVDEGITLIDICEPVKTVDLDAPVKDVLMQNNDSKVSSFNLGHLPRMNECSVKIRKSDITAAKRRITVSEQISPTAFTVEDFADDIGSDEPHLASKKKKPEEDSDYEPQEDEQESEDESDYSSEEDLEEECESSPTKTTEFWYHLNDSKKSRVKTMYGDLIEVVKAPVVKTSDSLDRSLPIDLYRCSVCRVETHHLVSIKRHIRKKEIYDPKQCTLCHELCSNKYLLSMHMKVDHTSCRNYPCSFEGCTHVNKTKGGLQRHEANVHRKEISLHCTWENCDKTFRTPYSLMVHMRIHSDSKPILCHLCAFRCRQKASLNWHMKTKHPNAPPP